MNRRRAARERLERVRNNPDEAIRDFIEAVSAVFEQISRGNWHNLDFIDNISRRLDDVQNGLRLMLHTSNNDTQIILHQIIQAVNEIKATTDRIIQMQENNQVVPNQYQGARGRPKF